MSKTARKFHAFVDGSHYPETGEHGIGGIIVDPSNHRKNDWFSMPMHGTGHSTQTDEIYAVAEALRRIPAGSVVVVHSDLKYVSQNANRMAQALDKDSESALAQAWRTLGEASLRHNSVELKWIRKKDSHRWHNAAHHLAQMGAKSVDVDFQFVFKESSRGGKKEALRRENRRREKGSRRNRSDYAIQISSDEGEFTFG